MAEVEKLQAHGEDINRLLARLREKFDDAGEDMPRARDLLVRDVCEYLILKRFRERKKEELRSTAESALRASSKE